MGIFGGIFAMFFIIFILFFGGIIFLIVYLSKGGGKPTTTQGIVSEQDEVMMKAAAGKSELVPWSNRKATDLGTSMRYKSMKAFKNTLSGKLYSREGERILSFHRIERGLYPEGLIAVSSTDFDLFYIFNKERVEMFYNKRTVGVWYRHGIITDKMAQQIGTAVRPNGVEVQVGGLFEYRSGEKYYPVILNNREVANIIINRRVSNFIEEPFSNDRDYGKVIQYKEEPTPDEEKTLLAMAVLEIVYHGFSFVDI